MTFFYGILTGIALSVGFFLVTFRWAAQWVGGGMKDWLLRQFAG